MIEFRNQGNSYVCFEENGTVRTEEGLYTDPYPFLTAVGGAVQIELLFDSEFLSNFFSDFLSHPYDIKLKRSKVHIIKDALGWKSNLIQVRPKIATGSSVIRNPMEHFYVKITCSKNL